jgi:hypothetical protein
VWRQSVSGQPIIDLVFARSTAKWKPHTAVCAVLPDGAIVFCNKHRKRRYAHRLFMNVQRGCAGGAKHHSHPNRALDVLWKLHRNADVRPRSARVFIPGPGDQSEQSDVSGHKNKERVVSTALEV